MFAEEINNLLSIELELLKDVRTYEAMQISKLKSHEIHKEGLAENNRKKAHETIALYRKELLSKIRQMMEVQNSEFETRKKSLARSYSGKIDSLLQQAVDELLIEAADAYTKKTI